MITSHMKFEVYLGMSILSNFFSSYFVYTVAALKHFFSLSLCKFFISSFTPVGRWSLKNVVVEIVYMWKEEREKTTFKKNTRMQYERKEIRKRRRNSKKQRLKISQNKLTAGAILTAQYFHPSIHRLRLWFFLFQDGLYWTVFWLLLKRRK